MTNELQIKACIDSLVALKAQIAALEAQEKALTDEIKSYMADASLDKLMSATGHKALLTAYETTPFDKAKMVAELGQQAYDHFCTTKKQTRFTVS